MTVHHFPPGRLEVMRPDASGRPTPRKITKWECEQAGMTAMPTLAELLAATVFARKRGDERRADLYMTTAVRRLLRAQREARRA